MTKKTLGTRLYVLDIVTSSSPGPSSGGPHSGPASSSLLHPRPQAQAREALTVALVQAVELLDCDWFFCPKGMLRVGTKCGLTLNNGWREE